MVICHIGKTGRQFSHTKTKKPDTALQCPARVTQFLLRSSLRAVGIERPRQFLRNRRCR
jgi:hypothetical protein